MAHAWLDSLSEDWVSQPGSDASDGQLPPLPPPDDVETPQIKQFASRIPRKAGIRSSLPPTSGNNSPQILSERSANDINISMKKLPSKLSQEIKADVSRSVSNDTNGSVVHNKVSSQRSPDKNGETPEWKRRLIYGEVAYGEQRDLFCSAAIGLQDMFKPPQEDGEESRPGRDASQHIDMTLPSSPPTYPQPITEEDFDEYPDFDEDEEYPVDVTPSPSPRPLQKDIKYRLNESSPIPDSRKTSQPSQLRGDYTPRLQSEDGIYRDESCLTAPEAESASRKPSGQSDTRNEDFSPILIGKHSGDNGKVDFAPIEMPVDQLWQKLERLRVNQMLLDSQADLGAGFETSPRSPAPIENTDDYIQNGGFINVRRGGRSGDGSFYNRGLSSEIGVDTSEMLPEESLQASTPKQFPSVRTLGTNPFPTFQVTQSPSLPRAPFPSPDKKQLVPEEAQPAASSPLKLFGPYDTFTNQTLLRRISQFEERSGSPSQRSTMSHNADHDSENEKLPMPSASERRSISKFGGGDLDGFEFRGELSDEIYEDSDAVGKENVTPNETSLPLYPLREIGRRDDSPDEYSGLVIERRRNKHDTPTRGRNSEIFTSPNWAPGDSGTPRRDPGSESKRPRTSPSKDPTPKRRRTLHRSDIAFGRETKHEAAEAAHLQMHSLLSSKKRKDALPGTFEVADPNVLALRSMLQPRNPTSSRSSSASFDQARRSPLRDRQNELPTPPSDAPNETDRKPSIRTQDFVDQAAQIMAMIRNQVQPELASLEESEEDVEGEVQQPSEAGSSQDSTSEPFSRPPSREGNLKTWAQARQDDPDLMDRLRKYQEFSDMGDVISSSVRSMGLSNNAILAAQNRQRHSDGQSQSRPDAVPIPVRGEIISDLPNVRITSNPLPTAGQTSPSREYPSQSSNRSTSQNYPSASSRGSDSKRIIMPESVSHLIPDRVGSMCLDKDKNVWVKRKESAPLPARNILPSEDSEDDPFASIPDLSVDMTKEMQNLRLAIASKELATDDTAEPGSPQSPPSAPGHRAYAVTKSTQQTSPRTGVLMSEEVDKLDALSGREKVGVMAKEVAQDDKESNGQSSTKRRNLTISFSSPIASVIRDLSPEDLDSFEESEYLDEVASAQASPHRASSRSLAQAGMKPRSSSQHLNATQAPLRQASLRGPAFIPRPVSRIDEQDEDSTVEIANEDRQLSIIGEHSMISHKTPDGRRASLSFMFNQTPGNAAIALAAEDSAFIGRNVGKLSLSPLSEFTLNNPDQSFGFEVSYVVGPRHMATGDGSKKVLSMTMRELVDRLGEAEPHESFWEDLAELDLHDKRLASLHMLDEFCGNLVTLDASRNKLNHLDGVPSTIRELKVSQNLLTELTSWDHLMNLQYVDISNNEVTSLSALKNLVHLRSIKADNNQLTSLDGLDAHDGLLSLRARNNMIEDVDFAVSRFERLETLDLSGNQIRCVENLEMLPVLARLKLSKNKLMDLPKASCMKSLRHLDVSDNELLTLDMAAFPKLHSMHADRNHISSVCGFDRTRRLDSLSLREQRGNVPLDLSFLSMAYEVRKLFLSGNYMQEFDPQVDFLNMQLLELANCGLQRLPDNMGQLMPNLRTLNVNFNALRDLSPLQFIPRLKKLLVAGNRLADSTRVTQLLTEFPHLTQLDVRDNPVTLGFYAPLQVLVPTDGSGIADPFILPDADVGRDETFASRLDEATRLRRRLHQVVLVASCSRLRVLDGLPVCRRDIMARDRLLQTLIDDGLVPDPERPRVQEGDTKPVVSKGEEGIDEETMADEQARAQLEDEAETAWQSTMHENS
ncbi:conserved leucine-rich repeat protein [Pochonia chlamydosporia 170]|uniref:Conserved leucine-rich repeat protein n=1 Tax=Pochonia chlamydosporia 170 TaxID=1380566 RepID=A0A179FVV3_METCM|nr:conserved leucine-rich repeat protein [Pochonia chlamydosporia 170]OAQ69744.1 conserved leucine-rich repeat protein [Pochonia chlamydosporia 170]